MNDQAIQTKNVLIIHQNFPGQFRSIALHLWLQPNIKVIGIGKESAPEMEGKDISSSLQNGKSTCQQNH